VADGLAYHALNRGINRDRVFLDDGNCRAIFRALAQTQSCYPFKSWSARTGQQLGLPPLPRRRGRPPKQQTEGEEAAEK
jgi:hypothetical protein